MKEYAIDMRALRGSFNLNENGHFQPAEDASFFEPDKATRKTVFHANK
jgi:hypothetical protein